ncbi:MAG: RNase adapter RapZ [Vulcanimicrobiaceae bacterium]
MSVRQFVVVAGLSGAGKSQAMKSFEDLGFYCADNLPPALALDFVALSERAQHERLAVALDVRTCGSFGDPATALDALAAREPQLELLFLEAADEVLVRRYSETRRRHPYEGPGGLAEAIARERTALGPLRARATRMWDTSLLTHAALKARIAQTYLAPEERRLAVALVSFGFKYGIPLDADLLFDVRFLPNPNYVPELRDRTGSEEPVGAFLAAAPQTGALLAHLEGLLDFLVPEYAAEGKSRLTVAIGCTGGRHRSVYIVERLSEHLRARDDVAVAALHRELDAA